eukprot:SAG31_NODE_3147_length_4620_cov_1.523114_6_plen_149_part_01
MLSRIRNRDTNSPVISDSSGVPFLHIFGTATQEYMLTLPEAERHELQIALVKKYAQGIRDAHHSGDTQKLFDALDHTGNYLVSSYDGPCRPFSAPPVLPHQRVHLRSHGRLWCPQMTTTSLMKSWPNSRDLVRGVAFSFLCNCSRIRDF